MVRYYGDRIPAFRSMFARVYLPAPLTADKLTELEADGYWPVGIERDPDGQPVEYVFVRRTGTPPTQAR
jgi:hypothetical protein